MPKNATSQLKAHLAGEVTTTASLWQITRKDGTSFYFTDHDQDITIGGHTYLAAVGYTRTAIQTHSDMSVDNLEVHGMFDSSTITNNDLNAGLFDFADVYLSLVNWADLTMETMPLRRGNLGDVQGMPSGIFMTQLNGLVSVLNHNVGDLYQPTCRSDVGDARCMVPIQPAVWQPNAPKTTDATQINNWCKPLAFTSIDHSLAIFVCTTAGTTGSSEPAWNYSGTTTDGTCVWSAEPTWMRSAVVSSVTDSQHFHITVTEPRDVDGWFNNGEVIFLTGNNAGRAMEIKSWVQAGSSVTLFLPFQNPIQVGDLLTIYPGCDKTLLGTNGCKAKFNNVINRQAEDYIPGTAFVIQGPSSVQ